MNQNLTNFINRGFYAFFALVILSAIAFGCATRPDIAVFNTEKLITDAAQSATHVFNQYYAQQTATAPASAELNAARDTLYDADRKMAATLSVVNALRLNYTQNPAQTNQSAMFIALQAASDQSSNIVALVKVFVGK